MTLDEYFKLGQTQGVTHKLLNDIMKHHGALAHSLGKKYGKTLDSGECVSYMFEALPDAIEVWKLIPIEAEDVEECE